MTAPYIPYVLIGLGGHARVLLDALTLSGQGRPAAILEADSSRWGQTWEGVPIVGGDEHLAGLATSGIRHFVLGLGSAGPIGAKKRLYLMAMAAGLHPLQVRHPSAILAGDLQGGEGLQAMALSIINPGVSLGPNVLINSGAIVEHDCQLGGHSHLATGAKLCGTVTVGEGVHIGAGAVVRQGLQIGAGAVVAMGAVVVKDVPPHTTVVGVPAQIKHNQQGGA
jgi:UDP-perosamine 4-acetyltransferase